MSTALPRPMSFETLPGSIYSNRPWLIEADDAMFERLFAECPEEDFAPHGFHSFGRRHEVLRIESGCFATCYGRNGAWDRMTGLFLPGSLLGAPKALLHPKEAMPLVALALSPVHVRRMPTDRFRAVLQADPALELRFWKQFARHQEAQLEGMLVNDADTVPVRLAKLFLVLASCGKKVRIDPREPAHEMVLSVNPHVSELAILVHATRSVVSRIFGCWEKAGLVRRTERGLVIATDFSLRFLEV